MLETFDPITYQELLTLIDVKIYKSNSPIVNNKQLASVFRKIAKYINQVDGEVFTDADLENSLTYIEQGKALDARQGKVLKDLIDTLSADFVDEIADRLDAEEDLQDQITTEVSDRIAAIEDLQSQQDDNITQTDIDNSITQYNTVIQGGAPSDANTLKKINDKIIIGVQEKTFPNIAARNTWNVASLPFQAYVVDDGDGQWALYKAVSTGTGATYIKVSDPDYQNIALTAPAVKSLYESNANTNAFTDANATKLGGIATGATANSSDAILKARSNHTGTQTVATISDFTSAVNSLISSLVTKLAGIENGATANDTDANLKARANHTGTQAISTVSGLQAALDNKPSLTGAGASGNWAITAQNATDSLNWGGAGTYVATDFASPFAIMTFGGSTWGFTTKAELTAWLTGLVHQTGNELDIQGDKWFKDTLNIGKTGTIFGSLTYPENTPYGITSFAYFNSKLYVVGLSDEEKIWYYDFSDSTWYVAYDGVGTGPYHGIPNVLCVYNSKLYCGFVESSTPSGSGNYILVTTNGTTWTISKATETGGLGSGISDMVVFGSNLYAICGALTSKVVKFDGTSWTTAYTGAIATVPPNGTGIRSTKITTFNNKIYVSTGTTIVSSSDGITWGTDSASYGSVTSWVTFNGRLYGYQNNGTHTIISTDGSGSWITHAGNFYDFYTDGIRVFATGITTGDLYYTKDFLTWIKLKVIDTVSAGVKFHLNGILYVGMYQVSFGQDPLTRTILTYDLSKGLVTEEYGYNIAEGFVIRGGDGTFLLRDDGTLYKSIPVITGSTVSIVSATTTSEYVFTGANGGFNLPDRASSIGFPLNFKNRGTDKCTIARAGSDSLWNTASVASVILNPGDSCVATADANYWNIRIIRATTIVDVTGTSQQLIAGGRYTANNASLVTFTLPQNTSSAVGDTIMIRGLGAGGWKVAQNAGDSIHALSSTTTTGVTGHIDSANRYDCVTLECVANLEWSIVAYKGAITAT